MSTTLALWLAAGAGFGGICRHLVDVACVARGAKPGIAVATVNVLGSAILGLVIAAYRCSAVTADTFTVVAVGWCGGFTTFSSAMTDVLALWDTGHKWAAVKLAVVPALCATGAFFGAYALGMWSWR